MNKALILEEPIKKPLRLRTRLSYGRRRLKRASRSATLGGIFLSFARVGLTGFGGGLAVIAQIRSLAVWERRWFTEREFAEAFALAQSLPGTNAGNAVTYIGLRLRGIRGALVAMAGFILPSFLMMIGLAILYHHLRSIPDTDRVFHGLTGAVVALIAITAYRIGRNTLVRPWQKITALVSGVAVAGFHATIIEVVLCAGIVGIYIDSFAERRWQRWMRVRKLAARRRERLAELRKPQFVGGYLTRAIAENRVAREEERTKGIVEPEERRPPRSVEGRFKGAFAPLPLLALPLLVKAGMLLALSVIFLRIGAVTFGGGFVMIPLIEAEVVNDHHWLTHQEFADAMALGQVTPGPVLITATFIGYRVAGTLGALVATLSVFLPAFVMTIAAGSSLRRFRANRQVQAFLRGVTPAVVGLLAAATWSIAHAGIHSWLGVLIAVICFFVLLRFRINAVWVIFGAGLGRYLIGVVFG